MHNSIGGIAKPVRKYIPPRASRMPEPVKFTREIPRIRPVIRLSWLTKSKLVSMTSRFSSFKTSGYGL